MIEEEIDVETSAKNANSDIGFTRSRRGMRAFDTGATRNRDDDAYDYEGFLSPLALRRYGEYMHGHRTQADGQIRDSDNWQKGIPQTSYMKSMWRHLVDVWLCHRKHKEMSREGLEEALCGVIFNSMGMLHEVLKDKLAESA